MDKELGKIIEVTTLVLGLAVTIVKGVGEVISAISEVTENN